MSASCGWATWTLVDYKTDNDRYHHHLRYNSVDDINSDDNLVVYIVHSIK